jgi:hypothetical protein
MRVGEIIRIDSPRAQVLRAPQIHEEVQAVAARYLRAVGSDAEQIVHTRQIMQRRFPGFLTLLWLHRRTMTNYECCIQYVNPQRNNLPRQPTQRARDGFVGAVEATIQRFVRKTSTFSFESLAQEWHSLVFHNNEIDNDFLYGVMVQFLREQDPDYVSIINYSIDPTNLTATATYSARRPTVPEGGVITQSVSLSSALATLDRGWTVSTLTGTGTGNLTVTSEGVEHNIGTVTDFQLRHLAEQQALESVITKPKENKTNRITLENEDEDAPRPNRADLLADE